MDPPSGQPWTEPTPIPAQPPDPNVYVNQYPSNFSPPSGNYPGGLQLINNLGYNPSFPYGGGGSGVPTQTGAGIGGSLIGAILGGLLTGGLGAGLGARLGGIGGRMLTRYIQGQGMNKQPKADGSVDVGDLENVTGNPPSGSPGSGNFWSSLFPHGLGFLGQNPGNNPTFVQWNRPEGFDPNAPGANTYGGGPLTAGPNQPGWVGGDPFGNSSYGARGQMGGFNIPGGINWSPGSPGGQLGMAGAKMALHGLPMQNWVQSQGYNNVNDWMQKTGWNLNTGYTGGGQGLAGAGKPMTKNV
jgi:hypothetical protein